MLSSRLFRVTQPIMNLLTSDTVMYDALDLYDKLFGFLWGYSLSWSQEATRFHYSRNVKDLAVWLLVVMANIIILHFMPIFGIAGLWVFGFRVVLPVKDLFTLALVYIFCNLVIIAASILFLFGEAIAVGFNSLFELEEKLRGIADPSKNWKKVDWFGLSLYVFTVISGTYPYIVSAIIPYLELDIFQIAIKSLSQVSIEFDKFISSVRQPLLIVRLVMTTLFILEVSRLVNLCVLAFCTLLKLILKVSEYMNVINQVIVKCGSLRMTSVVSIIRYHTRLERILQVVYPASSNGISYFLSFCFLLCVTLNFATFKLYNILPFEWYVVSPMATVALFTVLQIIIPMMVNIYESDSMLKIHWISLLQFSSSKSTRAYSKRKFDSIRTLRLYAGVFNYNIFIMKLPIKRNFFGALVDRTINVLLSVDTF